MELSTPTSVSTATPRVLLVVAHPDDEYYCAATIFRITQEVGGTVDQLIITNGEGGYRYSLLSERIYGCTLTDEKIGRDRLPAIRREETLRAGRILGIRNHYFLDQRDKAFTFGLQRSREQVWDLPFIEQQLTNLLRKEKYDFIFTVLPTEDTHEHHKAATLLALESVARMETMDRPVVLGSDFPAGGDQPKTSFSMLPGFPLTRSIQPNPVYAFDRRHKFGFDDALDYSIVVHWMMAEYKSQGYFQTAYGQHDLEMFWYFAINGPDALGRARAFFDKLQPGTSHQDSPVLPMRRYFRRRYRLPPGRRIMNYSERAASRHG